MEQINALDALRKDLPIYSKLAVLATKIRGRGPMPAEEQKTEGIFNFLATAVCDLLPKISPSHHAAPAKESPSPKKSNFYYDQNAGKWIIDGKEADTEYDMGQDPGQPRIKGDVAPPPQAPSGVAKVPRAAEREDEGEASGAIKDPFGQVRGTGAKKKPGVRSLYVPQ